MREPGTITVLLVDDHVMFAEALASMLSRGGIEVVGTAETSSVAVELASQLRPDVVLLDYALPDEDGVTTARLLREATPESRIVMLTGSTDESLLIRAIEAGLSGFITKDRAVDEVVSAVRAAHEGEALISPAMLATLLPRLRGGRPTPGPELTPREIEVLRLMTQGMTNKAIADRLVLSPHTVRNHVQSVLEKLHAHSRLEAVATAVKQGIVSYH